MIGAAIGTLGTLAAVRAPNNEYAIDHDNDGRVDERTILSGNTPIRIETDRNKDGKVDLIHRFDSKGIISLGESDEDFNGHLETSFRYLHNQWLSTEVDEDADGQIEYAADAIAGVAYSEEWKDAAGRTSKKVVYRNGWPSTVVIDTDGDGTLDTRRYYDKRVEIERSEPLPVSER